MCPFFYSAPQETACLQLIKWIKRMLLQAFFASGCCTQLDIGCEQLRYSHNIGRSSNGCKAQETQSKYLQLVDGKWCIDADPPPQFMHILAGPVLFDFMYLSNVFFFFSVWPNKARATRHIKNFAHQKQVSWVSPSGTLNSIRAIHACCFCMCNS